MEEEGIKIIVDKEVLIKGNKEDLLELSKQINEIATSDNNHIHLDELTIISSNSPIKELIIEKEEY